MISRTDPVIPAEPATRQETTLRKAVVERVMLSFVQGGNKMSKDEVGNVQGEMSKDVIELSDEELALPLEPFERQSTKDKKNKRRQAIIGMIAKDSHVSLKAMSEKLDVNIKTIWRDLNELKSYGVIERIGDDFTGEWKVCKKK